MWPLPAAARLGPARAPTELWVHHPGSPEGRALLPGGKRAPGKVLQKVTFKLTRCKHSRWLISGVMLVCTLTSMYKYSSNLHQFKNMNLYLISLNRARFSIYDKHPLFLIANYTLLFRPKFGYCMNFFVFPPPLLQNIINFVKYSVFMSPPAKKGGGETSIK